MAVAILLLTAALLFVLAKWVILRRDVLRIAATVRNIALGSGNRRLRVKSQDRAVAEIANAVNALYDKADEARAAQIRASDELRQNMADISHDLRTPLTSILGYLDLLARGDISLEKQKEFLAVSTGNAEMLRRMADSLFDLARLEAGAYHFELVALDAADVLAQEIAAFYLPFAATGNEPDIRLPKGRLPVLADSQALRRVFANLLQNILRHGGSEVEIAADRQNDRAHFRFSNQADNLTGETVQKIFQRSFTGDDTRNNKNTGLGLAITHQLVIRMNGEISAALDGRRLTIAIAFPLISEQLLSTSGLSGTSGTSGTSDYFK